MNLLLSDPAFIASISSPAGAPLLLDIYSGAAAAYSLRQLRTGVTNVIRVRRSSDNTEQDFTATQVTDGTLTAFCGAGNGFVRTWYDQSGNNDHATQNTTSYQPLIVSSGVLQTDSSKPALSFNGTTQYLVRGGHTYPFSVFSVVRSTGNGIRGYIGHGLDALALGQQQGGSFAPINSFWAWAPSQPLTYGLQNSYNTNRNLHTYVISGNNASTSWEWYNNGTGLGGFGLSSGTANATPSSGFIGASRTGVEWWQGPIQEIILYFSDQSTNRAAIESNINAHYTIY